MSYSKLIEDFKSLRDKQEKQRQRGLNDYNLLSTVLKNKDEVRLHSRVIHSLLNPLANHYQGILFLELFIEQLKLNEFDIDYFSCNVLKEKYSIDLYITDGIKHIIIENKLNAKEQPRQIARYVETIEEKNPSSYKDILVIYLSLEGKNPSKKSLDDLIISGDYLYREEEKEVARYKAISYKNDILAWLNKCQHEVQNITNLNESIKQYKSIVEINANKYEEQVVPLTELFKENVDNYKLAFELSKKLPAIRKEIAIPFFHEVRTLLEKKLGGDWCVEITDDNFLGKKHEFPFRVYKNSWKNKNSNFLLIGFEFRQNDYLNGMIGIVRSNDNVDIKTNLLEKFQAQLKSLDNKISSGWWLCNELFPENTDFVEFSLATEAKEKFVQKIIDLTKNKKLLTEINDYLAKKTDLR